MAGIPIFSLIVGLVFAVCLLGLGRLREPLRSRLQVLIWGGAWVVAGYEFEGWPTWPPSSPMSGLSLGAVGLALFVLMSPHAKGARYLMRALFTGALGLLVLWPIHHALGGPVHMRNLLAFFCLGLGVWSILERSAQRVKAPALILLPTFVAGGLWLFLRSRDVGSLMEPVMIETLLLCAGSLVALMLPTQVSVAAALPFVSVFLVAELAAVHFYLHANPWTLILLCLPYLGLWLREAIPFVPSQPQAEALTLGLLTLIPQLYFFWR